LRPVIVSGVTADHSMHSDRSCFDIEEGYINGPINYGMIYLTAIGLPPGGSSTVNIYTQTTHRTTQSTQTIQRTTQFSN